MTARCIRCGGEPQPGILFCERCLSAAFAEAAGAQVPREAPVSPWVRRAQQGRLPAKAVFGGKPI